MKRRCDDVVEVPVREFRAKWVGAEARVVVRGGGVEVWIGNGAEPVARMNLWGLYTLAALLDHALDGWEPPAEEPEPVSRASPSKAGTQWAALAERARVSKEER